MLVKVTAKRQVTFPAHVLDAMGVRPGDRLELLEGPHGFVIRPHKIDLSRLAPLKEQIDPDIAPFDVHAFRSERHDPSLRD
ncbi:MULTISPECIES: AbrB/MazE/SpoVT family DNA-binding domain-containing protein [Candidatus Palauibacter]|uniref:AbrB/MazE/SpoVT family DNA-binding domain-containing protein n=1 Tax=Candidatus Palauibacter TaxID=3056650 RepID=UPI003B01512C